MSEMKMSDVFDTDDFNIMHQAEIVDTSKYAYIEHNEIQIEGEAHINYAVLNHDRMVEEIAELREALEKSSEVLRRQLSKYYYKDEVAMLNQYESNKKLLNQLNDRANGK